MLPVGTLMIEHRLIERAIKLISDEISVMKEKRTADPEFIRIIIDFIKTYADKLHHGKEEDILFRDLALKNLSHEHAKIMEELIQEHILGRTITNDLVKARKDYIGGNEAAINKIIEKMDFLVRFYPKHIEKEDKHFFLPVMSYLSQEEQDNMLAAFNEFDRKFIHQKYKNIVSELEVR